MSTVRVHAHMLYISYSWKGSRRQYICLGNFPSTKFHQRGTMIQLSVDFISFKSSSRSCKQLCPRNLNFINRPSTWRTWPALSIGRRARRFKRLSHCLLSTAGFAEKLSFTNWTAAKSAATFFQNSLRPEITTKCDEILDTHSFQQQLNENRTRNGFLAFSFLSPYFEEFFNEQAFPSWTVFIDLFWLPRRHAGEVQVAQTSAQCQQARTPELMAGSAFTSLNSSTKCRTCPRGVRSRSSQRICSWRIKGSAPCPIAACQFSQNWSETWFQFLAARELNRFWGRLCKLCITSNVKIITMNCWRPL